MSQSALRAFHLVAQSGGFTKAAQAGGVSQPTLSAQVRALEEANGIRLFDRRGRNVALTPLGQNLHAITARLFAAEDDAKALLAGARNLARGHLRVAADSATHVMPLLAELKQRRPGLTFSLAVGNSSDVLRQVLDHAVDVAVMAKHVSDPRVHSLRLRTDRLVLFVPRSHPWGSRKSVALEALAGQDLVIRERGSITREVFEARLAEAGVKPGALVEVQTREAVREAVAAGFGIGIIFDSEFGQDPASAKLTVKGADLNVAEYVVCLEERRRLPLVRALLELVPNGAAG
jgi:LysR family transcriptional regulator, low CO2-responsive transcriptional regulator